jgi:cyclopropane-fatty-acyl-phospholipid synthase
VVHEGRVVIDAVVDRGWLPDAVVRAGIRRIVQMRLREQEAGGIEVQSQRFNALVDALGRGPVAVETEAANRQHYEVPAAFFELVLGPHLKYSSAWWPEGVETLADAEARMLALTAERAGCADGQRILELGCGWGSLTLYLASAFPGSRIMALSNSASQRAFVMARARARGLDNVTVVTGDVSAFDTDRRFDRVVSVEMLEHVRNHRALFARIARWLEPDGRFFAHVFAHRRFAYPFEARGASDWMARHFFTGGIMPSDDLFLHVQDRLAVERHWRFDGTHYQRTADAWLANLDRHRAEVDRVLASVHGAPAARRWRERWRVFFMACAEMFGWRGGQEWMVSHYRFAPRAA